MNNQDTKVHSKTYGRTASAASVGAALIGFSGTGKTSAMQSLLEHYPQVIRHHDIGGIPQFVQITYIMVNAMPNSNFSGLYSAIGAAIDRALGNLNGCYEQEIRKRRDNAAKLSKVKELIELFSIGVIILDEIQLMDFSSNTNSSYESLLTLSNETKVVFFTIGTEDAFSKMYPNFRTGRRQGVIIRTQRDQNEKKYFDFFVRQILKYNWTDEPFVYSEYLSNILYKYSHGVIDQLIGIYICLQTEYINGTISGPITEQMILEVSERWYPHLQQILLKQKNVESEIEYSMFRQTQQEQLLQIINDAEEEEAISLMEKSVSNEQQDLEQIKNNVYKSISLVLTDYNYETILSAINKCISKKPIAELDEKSLISEVSKKLLSGKKDTRKKQRLSKVDKKTMLDFVDGKLNID